MQPASSLHNKPALRAADIPPSQRHWLRRYRTWRRFHHGPRSSGEPLLHSLARYPDAVLVAGCQRSGTTMMTRVIAQSPGFRSLRLTHDDELDAALILAGKIDAPPGERYCLQTTYLNERYTEYRNLGAGQRLIWVLRNPYSVVFSMVFNWRRFALNELYEGCALQLATSARLRRAHLPWPLGPTAIEKACLAYSAKTAQIIELDRELPSRQVLVLEYDEVVHAPETWLPQIFGFVDAPYTSAALRSIQAGSTRKADALPPGMRETIERLAEPTYRDCLALMRRRAALQQEAEPPR